MKKTFLIPIICLLLVGVFVGKYFVEHSVGYGAIDYTNAAVPSNFLFTEKGEIPDSYRMHEDSQDIRQIGGMFSETFYCQTLGKDAEIVSYWKQTAGYGIVGGWSYRFAAVCDDTYVVVYGADHLGELIYGPFSLKDGESSF